MKSSLQKHKKLLISGTLIIGVLVFAWSQREPRFEGYSLGIWLDAAGNCQVCDPTEVPAERFAEAVESMGSDAIPHLIGYIRATGNPRWRDRVEKFFNQIPGISLNLPHQTGLGNVAVVAFAILGTNAVTAIPALTEIALENHGNVWEVQALEGIGPMALPALSNIVAQTDAPAQHYAVWALASVGSGASSVKPWFEQMIRDTNNPAELRSEMLSTLAEFAPVDDSTFAFLQDGLNDPELFNGALVAIARTGKRGWLELLDGIKEIKSTTDLARLNAVVLGIETANHHADSSADRDVRDGYSFEGVRILFNLKMTFNSFLIQKGRGQIAGVHTLTNFIHKTSTDAELLSAELAALERIGDTNNISATCLIFLSEQHSSEQIREKARTLHEKFAQPEADQ